MINIETFIFNPFYENTYVVWDSTNLEGFIIDPGCSNSTEEDELKSFISDKNISLKYLFNTHAHIDHIIGNSFIKENYDVIFIGSERDNYILEMLEDIGKNYGIDVKKSPFPDKYFNDNELLKIGNINIIVIFTPGHSPGEYCLYLPDEKICFTGDVLFRESIGRADLGGADYQALINSIESKLFTLPDETIIYPGHEGTSTIGYEKKHNPFF